MIRFLSIVIGLLVLGIAGLGVMLWLGGSGTVDPNTASFKISIKNTCKRHVGSTLGSLTRYEEVQDIVLDICECAADMTHDAFKNESPVTLISLATSSKVQAKAREITKECFERADIPTAEDLMGMRRFDESAFEEPEFEQSAPEGSEF